MRPRRIAYLFLFCASLYTLWPRSTRHETTAHARALIPTPRAQESTSARTGCPAHRSLAVMVMPDAYETESDYARVIGAWERAEAEACANRWRVRFHWVWPRDPPHTLPLPRILGEKKRVWFVDELIAYPPKQFVLRMWHQVATQLGGVYDWAVKMDADAYLSVQKLIARLEHFDPAVPNYFGGAGYGRPLIRDGVGVRYCMGMGYVLSLHLARLAFADETVLRQADRFPNSDIAVARRIMDAAKIQCNDNGGEHMSPLFVNNYYGVRQGLLYPRYINAKGQIDTPMFDRPPHHILHAVLVHPIKNMDQRRAFERVLDDGVYPTLPFDVRAVVETARDSAFGEARKYVTHYQTKVKGSCVANYAQQIVEYQHRLKSCEYTCRGKVLWQQALVHSLRPSTVRRRLEPLLAPLFDGVDFIHAVDGRALTLPATTLEPGEWGYRQTMRGILTRLAQSDDTAWVVMDDDVLVHENAKNMLAATLHDTYCGAALCGGGVLMLSASIWYNGTWPNLKGHYVGGWHLIDHDREAHKSLCASGHTGVLGSVAVAYTRPAARYILAWLDDPEKVHKPFDHVFADMASHGYPVRLLGEHVFAARLDTPSSTNAKRVYGDVHEVQRVHRWEMRVYKNTLAYFTLIYFFTTHELYSKASTLYLATSNEGITMQVKALLYALETYPGKNIVLNLVSSPHYQEPFCILDLFYVDVNSSITCDYETKQNFIIKYACRFLNGTGLLHPARGPHWQKRPSSWNTDRFNPDIHLIPFDSSRDTCLALRINFEPSWLQSKRKSLHILDQWVEEAEKNRPVNPPYKAIHWRRGDKVRACESNNYPNNINCVKVEDLCRKFSPKNEIIYISTDATEDVKHDLQKCGFYTNIGLKNRLKLKPEQLFTIELAIILSAEHVTCGKNTGVCHLLKILHGSVS